MVRLCEFLKQRLGLRTWHLESLTVTSLLILMYVLWGKDHGAYFQFRGMPISVEWIGSLAVLFTFQHASIGFRLEEQQALLVKTTGAATVECYYKLQKYFYAKELCWLSYFLLTGSYAALVGVGVFLLYGSWRRAWRNAHPLKSEWVGL